MKRKCIAGRQWTAVDFSGCTLSSNDQNVIVILSLWTVISSSNNREEINIQSLEELVYAHTPSLSSYVIMLPVCSKDSSFLHCNERIVDSISITHSGHTCPFVQVIVNLITCSCRCVYIIECQSLLYILQHFSENVFTLYIDW